MTHNIAYETGEIARYFAQHRVAWPQFYQSERAIIEQLDLRSDSDVLDIGCGCGGLGLALRERFGIERYSGVEINAAAAEAGRQMNPHARVTCGDILTVSQTTLRESSYDVVFSLSCVDWNVRFADMLSVAWKHVRPGGHLVATFRLTLEEGCNDIERSYQFINFEGKHEGERAAYVVLNARDLLEQLSAFHPSGLVAYGYWGVPSPSAVTPYETLCFAAFSMQKRTFSDEGEIRLDLKLPAEVLENMEVSPR